MSDDENYVSDQEPPTHGRYTDKQYMELQSQYDMIDDYRKQHDVIYRFFDAMEVEYKRQIIKDLINNLKVTYYSYKEEDELRYFNDIENGVANPQLPKKYDPDEIINPIVAEQLDIIDNSDDNVLRDSFWFFCLYCIPSFQYYMLYGNPQKNIPPEPCNNRDNFKLFISLELNVSCEKFLKGYTPESDMKLNFDMTHKMEEFVRYLRLKYFLIVGVPDLLPEPERG